MTATGEQQAIDGLKSIIAQNLGEREALAVMSAHLTACIATGLVDNKPGTMTRVMAAAFGVENGAADDGQ